MAKLHRKIGDEFEIVLNGDEIAFLCNAINEALEALDDREFQTRTGLFQNEARNLQKFFKSALSRQVDASGELDGAGSRRVDSHHLEAMPLTMREM